MESDGALRWEVHKSKFDGMITHLAMSPDGSAVAVGTEKGGLAWVDSDGALRGEVHTFDGEMLNLGEDDEEYHIHRREFQHIRRRACVDWE